MKNLYTYYFSCLVIGGIILLYGFYYYLTYFPDSQLQIQSNEYIHVSFNAYLIGVVVLAFFVTSLFFIVKIRRKSGSERRITNTFFLCMSTILVLFFGSVTIYATPTAYQHYKILKYESDTKSLEQFWPAK